MNSEILRILEDGESETAEFKGPQTSVDVVAREICAMLNQKGGVILWGITDGRRVVGVRDPDEQVRKLTEYVARYLHPRPLLSISIDKSEDRPVVVVDIPPGADKPYSVQREIWIRIAARTLRAAADVSTALVEQSAIRARRWERSPMPGFAIEDCDRDELTRCKSEIAGTGRFGIALPDTDVELLESLNLVRFGQPTNGCVVLFSRNPRVWAPQLSMRITVHAGDGKESVSFDTALEGPAVGLVSKAISIVMQQTGVSSSFNEGSIQRADRPAYPLFALREGLVNALVHRDYTALGEVSVEIHPHYLVIRNPGRLPSGWTASDLRREHVSKPTNPDIARTFLLRGYMEQLGVGTQKLIAACRAIGAKSPVWDATKGTVGLRIFRAAIEMPLNARQTVFLDKAKPGKPYSLHEYARIAKVSERQARRDLAGLVQLGLAVRLGRARATTYVPSPKGESLGGDRDVERRVRQIWASAPTKNSAAVRSVDAMMRWFFERFEDPANGVPHDTGEGGYQYIAGGPYDAEEELRNVFDDGTARMDRLISAAARQIEKEGWEWVRRGEY